MLILLSMHDHKLAFSLAIILVHKKFIASSALYQYSNCGVLISYFVNCNCAKSL